MPGCGPGAAYPGVTPGCPGCDGPRGCCGIPCCVGAVCTAMARLAPWSCGSKLSAVWYARDASACLPMAVSASPSRVYPLDHLGSARCAACASFAANVAMPIFKWVKLKLAWIEASSRPPRPRMAPASKAWLYLFTASSNLPCWYSRFPSDLSSIATSCDAMTKRQTRCARVCDHSPSPSIPSTSSSIPLTC